MEQSPQSPPPKPATETYATRLAAAIIEDWRGRGTFDLYGRRLVIALQLDVHLPADAEKGLRELLTPHQLSFSFNQVYANGRIEWQRNVILLQRWNS